MANSSLSTDSESDYYNGGTIKVEGWSKKKAIKIHRSREREKNNIRYDIPFSLKNKDLELTNQYEQEKAQDQTSEWRILNSTHTQVADEDWKIKSERGKWMNTLNNHRSMQFEDCGQITSSTMGFVSLEKMSQENEQYRDNLLEDTSEAEKRNQNLYVVNVPKSGKHPVESHVADGDSEDPIKRLGRSLKSMFKLPKSKMKQQESLEKITPFRKFPNRIQDHSYKAKTSMSAFNHILTPIRNSEATDDSPYGNQAKYFL